MSNLTPYLPPVSGDADSLVALLHAVSNPAEAKKALEKMVEERKAIDAATLKQQEEFAKGEIAARKTRAENEKIKAEGERLATQAAIDLGAAKATLQKTAQTKDELEAAERRLVEKRADLERREEKIGEMEKLWQAKQADLHDREEALKQRVEHWEKREANLSEREKQLADDIAENTKWLASLKPPRGH